MNYLKRITALSVAVLLILSLAACGGKSQISEPYSREPDESVTIGTGDAEWLPEGRYISGKNGEHIIDIENEGPVIMHFSGAEGETIFDGLSDGDLIKISCTAVAESYPGSTEIFSLELIEKGSPSELNSDTVSQLRQLGWIE